MKGPFSILLYNSIFIKPEERLSKMLPVNFLKIILAYFNQAEVDGNHQNIIKNDFKIYCYKPKTLSANSELMISGIKGIKEILKLAKINNWTVVHPTQKGLINLSLMSSDSLDSYIINIPK